MTHLAQDLRFAVRSFLRAPRFTIPAVLALALGVGASSAMFSVVRGVALAPLPYRDAERIVAIYETNVARARLRNVIAPANFVEWGARTRSLEHLAMVGPTRLNLMLDGQPEEVAGLSASSETFAALGVAPVSGRPYTAAEDLEGNDAVIVLTHEFWQRRLGGRADVVGMTIPANGRARTVVGIMPPGFNVMGRKADYLVPYGWTLQQLRGAPGRGSSHAIARLRDGVTLEQASEEMRGIMRQLEQEQPRRNTGWSVALVPVHENMIEGVRPALAVLSGAVLLVLLVACVNVANLLLARATARQRELGLRTALGAGRGRLVRQLMTESLLLGGGSGIAGLACAAAFHQGLLALVADRIPVPRLDQVSLDGTVVLATLAIALGTSVVFGLLPAFVAARNGAAAVRDSGRHGAAPRSRRILGALVVSEVALSLVLLAGAGLLVRSFMRLQDVNPGFQADGLLTARVQVPAARYDEPVKVAGFYREAIERVRQIPGVRSAAGVSFLPLAGPGIGTSFHRLDRPEPASGESPTTSVLPVTPGYLRTMGIPQIAGRDFTEADVAGKTEVAIVSQALVDRYLQGENPIGLRLRVAVGRVPGLDVEVVGVAGDVRLSSLDAPAGPTVYVPHAQLAIGLMTLVVRTDLDPTSLVSGVAGAVRSLDPEVPLADVRTMGEVVDLTLARSRAVSAVLSAFAIIALVLAGVGVYGVMAYSVSQRTQEFGVRLALGATAQSVFRLVLGQSLRLVGAGVAVGLLVAAAATRVLGAMLYETDALDPLTFVVTSLLLMTVAALAAYVPARRGTRVAPVEALRAE